jgi:hypothetical protein
MPYSFSTFDEKIYEIANSFRPTSVLDVGAGAGKIGKIVSKSARIHQYSCKIIGYEIYQKYIGLYDLKWIYDEIINKDIMTIVEENDVNYDIIFFGDSLEHISKENGLKLLEFLRDKCEFIVIITPENYPQGEVEGNAHEAHLSNWTIYDFKELYHVESKEHINKQNVGQIDIMNLFVLRGKRDAYQISI